MNGLKGIALGSLFGLLATIGVFALAAGIVEFAGAATRAKAAGRCEMTKLALMVLFCLALAAFCTLHPGGLKKPFFPYALIHCVRRSWANASHPIVFG